MPGEVILTPNPGPQTWALSCRIPEIFYGGARGGGKGIFLILDWLRHCHVCRGKARGLLIRKYLTDLQDFQRESSKHLLKLGWRLLESMHEWRGPDGSVLAMRYLEREADAERYQGWNLSWYAVDEAGQFANPDPIDLLRATLRYPDAAERVMRLTGNPGGAGHRWLKERYVDPAPPMTPHLRDNQPCVFVPARLKDNPLCDTPEYRANLLRSANGRHWLVKAWLEGDWNVQPPGGVFDVDKINLGPTVPRIDRLVTGWDTALSTKDSADETAGMQVGRDESGRLWIVHLVHGRWDAGRTAAEIVDEQRRRPSWQIRCEGGPAGLAIEPGVRDWARRRDVIMPFKLISHMKDKIAKAGAFATAVNSGQVWIPEGAAWWPYLRDQLLTFDGKDGKADDCVDAGGVAFRSYDDLMAAHPEPTPPAEPSPRTKAEQEQRRRPIIVEGGNGPRRMWGG